MQQTNDTILKAIALIENPAAWTQGQPALDMEGASVPPDSPRACRWCTLGAIDKVSDDYYSWREATHKVRGVLKKEEGRLSITSFNDTHTHAEVLALLRKAAA